MEKIFDLSWVSGYEARGENWRGNSWRQIRTEKIGIQITERVWPQHEHEDHNPRSACSCCSRICVRYQKPPVERVFATDFGAPIHIMHHFIRNQSQQATSRTALHSIWATREIYLKSRCKLARTFHIITMHSSDHLAPINPIHQFTRSQLH